MLQKVVNNLFRKAVKNSDGTVGYSMSMEKTIGTSLGGAFAISDYNESRDNGNGVISSALLAAGNFALSNMVGMPAYLAMSGTAFSRRHCRSIGCYPVIWKKFGQREHAKTVRQ